MSIKYWNSCIEEILDELKIEITLNQKNSLVEYIDNCSDMQRESCGYYNIPDPRENEIKQLKESLRKEREAEFCSECKGRGSVTENAGGIGRSCTSMCFICNGNGKIYKK